MAGKSGSGQVFTSSKVTNASHSNVNGASRHKNHSFNHSPSYASHNITHQAHAHVQNSHLIRPHSPSTLTSNRINSSSSLSTSFNYNSPLAAVKASPSTSSAPCVSPLASISRISYNAPVTCSMFYKNALKKRKNNPKKNSKSSRDNRNRDSSPVHPSALVSYFRGEKILFQCQEMLYSFFNLTFDPCIYVYFFCCCCFLKQTHLLVVSKKTLTVTILT